MLRGVSAPPWIQQERQNNTVLLPHVGKDPPKGGSALQSRILGIAAQGFQACSPRPLPGFSLTNGPITPMQSEGS
jgi:hypothetical protein